MSGWDRVARIPRAEGLVGLPALLPFGLDQRERILSARRHKSASIGASLRAGQSRNSALGSVIPSPPCGERARVRGRTVSSSDTFEKCSHHPSPQSSPFRGERKGNTFEIFLCPTREVSA